MQAVIWALILPPVGWVEGTKFTGRKTKCLFECAPSLSFPTSTLRVHLTGNLGSHTEKSTGQPSSRLLPFGQYLAP